MATNIELYERCFINVLKVEKSSLKGLKYQDVTAWDSVGHMSLMVEIEDAFDIMMDTDDIIDFSSYEIGKKILSDNYEVKF